MITVNASGRSTKTLGSDCTRKNRAHKKEKGFIGYSYCGNVHFYV